MHFTLRCCSYNQVQMPYFKVSKQDITIIVLLEEEQKLVIHPTVSLLRLVLMLYWARVSMPSISLELRRSRTIWNGSELGRGREEPVPRRARELRRDTLYKITSLILYKIISLTSCALCMSRWVSCRMLSSKAEVTFPSFCVVFLLISRHRVVVQASDLPMIDFTHI